MYVEKGYYKGWKLRINNSKKVRNLSVRYKERIIEYNPDFFARINQNQEYWLLEWAIRSRQVRDPFKCDVKTRELYLSKGYPMEDIFKLYATMRFHNKAHKNARYQNLLTGKNNDPLPDLPLHTIYYKITDFLQDIIKWINRKIY